jgi:four helix bundle protein
MMKNNLILDKTFEFALDIIHTYKILVGEQREYVLSKQLLRSGTSIGANMREANLAISKKEFIAKTQIALKEASETEYWIQLLVRSAYLKQESDLLPKINEIIRILTAILKTSKENLNA